jgi:hypothetical protein
MDTLRKSLEKELKNQGVGEDEAKLAAKLIGKIFDTVEKTVATKKTNSGLALVLNPTAVTILAGATIADGADLQATVKELIDELKKNDEVSKTVKFGEESVGDVHLYTVSMATPEEEMKKFLGDKLEAVIGVGSDKLFVAAGRDAASTLKKAIEKSNSSADKDVPPFEIRLSLKKIAKFVAEVSDDEQVKSYAIMVGGSLEMAGEKDHVSITAQPISQGVRVRLEVEEGILQVIGAMSKMLSPAGGMPPTN